MKRREAAGSSSTRIFIRGVYKTSHKYGEFVARFLGRAREESWGLVVFENGIVKEIAI
jgi:hypothetical protein